MIDIARALAITGRTSDDDIRWLAEQAQGRDVIIELGPYQGRSTRALADNCHDGLVYAIDNWNAAINHWQPDKKAREECFNNLSDLIADGQVLLIEWNSQDGPGCFRTGFKADMLWIDADHEYEAVLNDIKNFAPLVRAGGLVCGHDYSVHHKGVMQAVDEVYGTRVNSLGIHRSIWWVNV